MLEIGNFLVHSNYAGKLRKNFAVFRIVIATYLSLCHNYLTNPFTIIKKFNDVAVMYFLGTFVVTVTVIYVTVTLIFGLSL